MEASIASGLTVLLGVVCAWRVTRSITRPLHEAVRVVSQVAEGNLTAQVAVKSKDETGQLLNALKTMVERTAKPVKTHTGMPPETVKERLRERGNL